MHLAFLSNCGFTLLWLFCTFIFAFFLIQGQLSPPAPPLPFLSPCPSCPHSVHHTFMFSFSHKPQTIPHTEHFLSLSHALYLSSLPLRIPLSTLHTVSAMQHALQAVTVGWGLGLQKEALFVFLFALTLLIKQASSTTTTTTPVSWLSFFQIKYSQRCRCAAAFCI